MPDDGSMRRVVVHCACERLKHKQKERTHSFVISVTSPGPDGKDVLANYVQSVTFVLHESFGNNVIGTLPQPRLFSADAVVCDRLVLAAVYSFGALFCAARGNHYNRPAGRPRNRPAPLGDPHGAFKQKGIHRGTAPLSMPNSFFSVYLSLLSRSFALFFY